MFSSLSFNQRARRFWNERNHAGKPGVAREVSTPSCRTNAAGRSVGILLFPVSVGLIAVAITGVFFGIGFWLLASPVRQTISDSGRDQWLPKIISWPAQLPRWATLIAGMIGLLKLLGGLLVGLLRSHAAREAEMAFLRQQLVVLKRSAPARLRLRTADRPNLCLALSAVPLLA